MKMNAKNIVQINVMEKGVSNLVKAILYYRNYKNIRLYNEIKKIKFFVFN